MCQKPYCSRLKMFNHVLLLLEMVIRSHMTLSVKLQGHCNMMGCFTLESEYGNT